MPEPANVYVSGIGILSPLAAGVEENWSAVKSGQRALASEISGFTPSQYVKRRYLKPLDDVTLRCIGMAGAAIADSAIDMSAIDPARVGVVIGSVFAGIGCIFEFKQACREVLRDGQAGISPLHFPGVVFNSLSGQPAIEFNCRGPNSVVNAGLASGLVAVIRGIEYIRSGKADVVIAGGAEMSHPFIRRKFEVMKDAPQVAALGEDFRPAEAVCLFLLRREDDPRFGCGRHYATAAAWRHGFLPEGCTREGIGRMVEGLPPAVRRQVGAVVLSSPRDSALASAEEAAMRDVLAPGTPELLCNKGNFGHALGAAGSLDVFHGSMLVRDRVLGNASATLVNAIDPAGNCACLVLK